MSTLLRVSRSNLIKNVYKLRSFSTLNNHIFNSYPSHTIIGMPALSPTMTHGNLAIWSKNVGDKLAPGDVLAEVETDKAQMDFEFQDDGYLAKILVQEGTKDIPVNKPIAIYVEEQDDVKAFENFTLEQATNESKPKANPTQETIIEKKEQPKQEQQVTKSSTPSSSTSRIIASPLAKVLALEHGIALKNIKGTGPHGRIIKDDVETYLTKQETSTATSPVASTPGAPASAYEDIEISNMRSIIAKRLLESTNSIPSYIVS